MLDLCSDHIPGQNPQLCMPACNKLGCAVSIKKSLSHMNPSQALPKLCNHLDVGQQNPAHFHLIVGQQISAHTTSSSYCTPQWQQIAAHPTSTETNEPVLAAILEQQPALQAHLSASLC